MAYLIGMIDDLSRRDIHSKFYFNSTLPRLEDILKKAVTKHGTPISLYVVLETYALNEAELAAYCREKVDQRPHTKRPEPQNKLSERERKKVLEVANSKEYANLPPSQIVPKLADKGQYT